MKSRDKGSLGGDGNKSKQSYERDNQSLLFITSTSTFHGLPLAFLGRHAGKNTMVRREGGGWPCLVKGRPQPGLPHAVPASRARDIPRLPLSLGKHQIKLHLLAHCQAPVGARGDRAGHIVDKDISAAVRGNDEAEALGWVEDLAMSSAAMMATQR